MVFKCELKLQKRTLVRDLNSSKKRKGLLLEVKWKNTELGRNSFAYRGSMVWYSLNRSTRDLERIDTLKATLKCNKTRLNKITFSKGTTNLNKDNNFLYYELYSLLVVYISLFSMKFHFIVNRLVSYIVFVSNFL